MSIILAHAWMPFIVKNQNQPLLKIETREEIFKHIFHIVLHPRSLKYIAKWELPCTLLDDFCDFAWFLQRQALRPELLYLSVYGSADPIFQVLENKNNGFLLPKSFIFPENSCMIIRTPVFTTHLGPINACLMACIVLCFKRFNDHKPKRV